MLLPLHWPRSIRLQDPSIKVSHPLPLPSPTRTGRLELATARSKPRSQAALDLLLRSVARALLCFLLITVKVSLSAFRLRVSLRTDRISRLSNPFHGFYVCDFFSFYFFLLAIDHVGGGSISTLSQFISSVSLIKQVFVLEFACILWRFGLFNED